MIVVTNISAQPDRNGFYRVAFIWLAVAELEARRGA